MTLWLIPSSPAQTSTQIPDSGPAAGVRSVAGNEADADRWGGESRPWPEALWRLTAGYALLASLVPLVLALRALRRLSPATRSLLLRLGVASAMAALVAGEVANVFDEALGFNPLLELLGIGVCALVTAATFWPSFSMRLKEAVSAVRDWTVREFEEPPSPAPAWGVAGVLAVAAVVGLFVLVLDSEARFQFPDVQPFTNIANLLGVTRGRSLIEILLLDARMPPPTHCSYWLLLTPFLRGLDHGAAVLAFLRANIVALAAALVVGAAAYRRQVGWKAVAFGGVFFLVIASTLQPMFWNNEWAESALALGFQVFVSLVLLAQDRVRSFVVMGLVAGFVTASKEVGLIALAAGLAWLVASDADGRSVGRRLLGFVAGFGVGAVSLFVENARSPVLSQGLRHVPFLVLRGSYLTEIGQAAARGRLMDQDFSFLEILRARLSFQTVGELAVGVAATALLVLQVFPVHYVFANTGRGRRPALVALLATVLLFCGIAFWKGGNSPNPWFLLALPGSAFLLPSLGRTAAGLRGALARRRVGSALAHCAIALPAVLTIGFGVAVTAAVPVRQAVGTLSPAAQRLHHAIEAAVDASVPPGRVGLLLLQGCGGFVEFSEKMAEDWVLRGLRVRTYSDDDDAVVDDRLLQADTPEARARAVGNLPKRSRWPAVWSGLVLVCPDGPAPSIQALVDEGCADLLEREPGETGRALLRVHPGGCPARAVRELPAIPEHSK